MNWKCEVCDTANTEADKSCFVCGTVRSESSVRESTRREKEKRRSEIYSFLNDNGYRILTRCCCVSMAVCAVVMVITVAISIWNFGLESIFANLSRMLNGFQKPLERFDELVASFPAHRLIMVGWRADAVIKQALCSCNAALDNTIAAFIAAIGNIAGLYDVITFVAERVSMRLRDVYDMVFGGVLRFSEMFIV